jgi:hypothetical protein
MSPEERKKNYDQWEAKRLKKATESPAKRTAIKTLIAENQAEYDGLVQTETAKAPAKTWTPEQIEEKVEKFRKNLITKGPKNAGKRAAQKKLIAAHKEDYEKIQADELGKIRGGKANGPQVKGPGRKS